MKAIYEYEIEKDYLIVEVPKGSKTLCCQRQRQISSDSAIMHIVVWIEVDLDEKKKERKIFRLILTGEKFVAAGYVSTIQNNGITMHLYETTISAKKEDNE